MLSLLSCDNLLSEKLAISTYQGEGYCDEVFAIILTMVDQEVFQSATAIFQVTERLGSDKQFCYSGTEGTVYCRTEHEIVCSTISKVHV